MSSPARSFPSTSRMEALALSREQRLLRLAPGLPAYLEGAGVAKQQSPKRLPDCRGEITVGPTLKLRHSSLWPGPDSQGTKGPRPHVSDKLLRSPAHR